MEGASVSFRDLKARFFLALNNKYPTVRMDRSLFIHHPQNPG